MKVLLSIKPEFAERIFDGSKKYEFRKSIFKNPDVKIIVVYASSPVQRVIGKFEIETVLSESPDTLWRITKKHSGISEDFFFDYFLGKEIGFAIEVKKTQRFKRPRRLRSRYNITPPQSFCYV